MIIYAKLNLQDDILFVVPPIIEGTAFDNTLCTNLSIKDLVYGYFPKAFVAFCSEITLYDLCTDKCYPLKNRGVAIDNTWQFGTISSCLNGCMSLATFHNGSKLQLASQRTGFKTIKIRPKSIDNFEEYLRAIDEIYSFF